MTFNFFSGNIFVRYNKFLSSGYLFCKSTYIRSIGYKYASIEETYIRGSYIGTISIKSAGRID